MCIRDRYVGSAATFSALPSGGEVSAGDVSILTADNGGNQSGWYVRNAGNTAWDFIKEIPETVAAMVAATAGGAGAAGFVPAPAAGQQTFFLTGGATYVDPITATPIMVGSGAGTAGVQGLVPTSSAGDQDKYLRADGTWQTVSIATETLQATTAAGNVTTLDMEINDAGTGATGLILFDGTNRWRITINAGGALVTTQI